MGNKAERHRAIQEIVRREEIGTQKELVERLRQLGFEVTQATVSRDIAELGLARIALGKGRHRYVLRPRTFPRTPTRSSSASSASSCGTWTGEGTFSW